MLTKGNYYNFSVGSWFGNTGFGIWMDFNQDGDFEDSLEFVYASPTAGMYFTGSIFIPSIALPDTTRIRVRCKFGDVISASQSCSFFLDRGETEDYIAIIKEPAKPPTSKFKTDKKISCNGFVQFTDLSTNLPESWDWYFGDGSSDTVQNPLHLYKQDSTYDITLITSNQFGSDTIIVNDYIFISTADTMMCRICESEHFKSIGYECDSTEQLMHIPDSSTEIKTYYLHFLVVRDDSGKGNGNITQNIIDSLVVMTNNLFKPWKIQFCSNSTDFINDTRYAYLDNADSIMRFRDIYGKYKDDQINVAITNYSLLGLSGNPLLIDFTVVDDYNSTGASVLAHELGHNFQLGHVSNPSNLMYPSCCGTAIDSFQIGTMHCFAETENPLYSWYGSWLSYGNKVCKNITGSPYGRFYVENTGGCSPLTVNFLDSSSFNPTNWYWDFGDGAFDTVENPVHIYTKSGRYSVKMIVSNTFGNDTVIKDDFVNVKDSVYGLPVLENFEDSVFPPIGWHIFNSDQQIGWQKNTFAHGNSGSGYYNKGSISMQAWPGNYDDPNDVLITANYNFRYVTNPFLAFDISYPKGSWDNGLIIWINSNCGDTFQLLHAYGSPFLNSYNSSLCLHVFDSSTCAINGIGLYDIIDTLGTYTIDTNYAPIQFIACEPEHWRRDTIWLKFLEGNPNVSFKFKFIPHFSNENLYLDDILISAEKISGLPVANFTADTTTIYKNDTIHFTNLSNKYSDTLQWFFTGATIATSSDTNPSVVYDSVGIFSVTLVVWNMFGRDTLTKLAYINVLQKIIDTIPCDSMKIILSKNDLSCKGKNDGTVTASAFSSNAPYSFAWSTGSTSTMITGLAEGTYTVTVTDSIGCTKTAYITITEPPILSSNLAYSNVSCLGGNDGNAVVSTYGGNGSYSYSWSNGSTSIMITGLAEGIYTVTVTDSIGCTKTDSVKISYTDSLPVAGFTYSDTIVKIYFTNLSTNTDSYLWIFGDNNTDTTASPLHIYSDLGIYIACLIASNNCGSDTVCDTISIVDGIKENSDKIYLKIYPNPNTGSFTIIIEQPQTGEIQLTLTNILGQVAYSTTTKTKIFKEELNLSNFGKGVYSLRVVTNEGSVSRKIIYR